MLDHAAEKISALLFPVDGRKGLGHGGQHLSLHAMLAGGGIALDHQGLQTLDHDAAAHLDGTGHANGVSRDLGVAAPGEQMGQQVFGVRAAQLHGGADAVRWHRGHHSGLDITPTRRVDHIAAKLLGAGRGRVQVQKKRTRADVGRHGLGHRQCIGSGDRRHHQVHLLRQFLGRGAGMHPIFLGMLEHDRAACGVDKAQVPGAGPRHMGLKTQSKGFAHLTVTHHPPTRDAHGQPFVAVIVFRFWRGRSPRPSGGYRHSKYRPHPRACCLGQSH